jgi:hypothetical protein
MENGSLNNRTEEILNSLDGLEHATAPDYFYTRLKGRMEVGLDKGKRSFVLLRPAFLMTTLSLILMVNIASLLFLQKGSKTEEKKSPASIENFADTYNLNSSSLYQ